MRIIVDYELLHFIETNKCPEVSLSECEKKYFRRVVDFSSIDSKKRPINDTYLAIDYHGYGYPFSCSKDQIKQGLDIVIANLK